jgi:pimeloyl-ACP methyl ester carboxylesterase
MPPTLVLRGAEDRIVSLEDVHGFAGELGAETVDVPAHGHWLLDPPASEECVDRIHRWLVRQLGEDLLELHAEAMAERNDTE